MSDGFVPPVSQLGQPDIGGLQVTALPTGGQGLALGLGGRVDPKTLGSGTPAATTFLRGDGTWAGGYTNYTPVWTTTGTAPAIGNASVASRYLQLGKFVHYYGIVIFGSTSTFGTGTFMFSTPVASLLAVARSNGSGDIFDSSASARGVVTAEFASASTLSFNFGATYLGTATPVGQTTPWTWATSDFISWNLLYEAA